MKIRLLSTALLAGLAFAQTANAQDFDDRWYLTGSAGFNIQDADRDTRNAPFLGLGLGKFISDNWSLDGELNYQNPNFEANQNLNWSQYGISLDLRRHFITEGRTWNPYALVGLGFQRTEEEYDAFPSVDSPAQREDGNLAAKVGVGLQGDMGPIGVRTELAYRADFDDQSVAGADTDTDWFGDVLASVGIIVPLGAAAPAATPAPAPAAAPSCADGDDDGDGVNNCDDKCPGSQAGQTIGPDGCPVPVLCTMPAPTLAADEARGVDHAARNDRIPSFRSCRRIACADTGQLQRDRRCRTARATHAGRAPGARARRALASAGCADRRACAGVR